MGKSSSKVIDDKDRKSPSHFSLRYLSKGKGKKGKKTDTVTREDEGASNVTATIHDGEQKESPSNEQNRDKSNKQLVVVHNEANQGDKYKAKVMSEDKTQQEQGIRVLETPDGSFQEYVKIEVTKVQDTRQDGAGVDLALPVAGASSLRKILDKVEGDEERYEEIPKFFQITSMDCLRPAHTIGNKMSFLINTKPRQPQPPKENRRIDKFKQWQIVSTWFLGPKAENEDIFLKLAELAFSRHCEGRRKYARTDPVCITDNVKDSEAFKRGVDVQKKALEYIVEKLEQSVPSFSPRYQGHMLWDTAMPANLGYLAALLYNQNNVALEASPVTTELEIKVGKQLCDMIFESHKHLPDAKDKSTKADQKIKPWGHLVAGGSIANIEALWTTRNAKFVPLAMKKILLENPIFEAAKDYEIQVPRLKEKVKLIDASSWDLLNMDMDDVIELPCEVARLAKCDEKVCMDALMKFSVMQLGLHGVMTVFNLKHAPKLLAPATAHYSWRKAANILGLGIDNLIAVGVDESARMDEQDLIAKLRECQKNEIPVLSVVPVMGTTEESAVDPLTKILEIRERAKEEGLNFAINADAAWGGYFMTMLHRTNNVMKNKDHEEYVPACSLSFHTIDQLSNLHRADTVTIDPHKSGFIPYPAGGLCYRNGKMRKFIKMAAQVVSHDDDEDYAMGICAIEGSKPGAAAAAVYMAHETIGLNGDGYGRILGQCTFGAKLFYCKWLTLAKDDDNFICIPMKDVPKEFSLTHIKETINSSIFGPGMKTQEILQLEDVTRIIRYCGPDTLINAFAINIKGNQDVDKCNRLNKLLFDMLSHSSSKARVNRVPLILTQSFVSPSNAYRVVEQFEKRLELKVHPTKDLHFLINTVMNPWVGQPELVANLGNIFRDTVLTAIGTIEDNPALYTFVCVGRKNRDNSFFAEMLPSFTSESHQYHVVVKFKITDQKMARKFGNDQSICSAKNPLMLETLEERVMGEFLQTKGPIKLKCVATNDSGEKTESSLQVEILDVPRFQHFDNTRKEYYDSMKYFLYGDSNGAHMSHLISHSPDFFQVINLDFVGNPDSDVNAYVCGVDASLLEEGIFVEVQGMDGQPVTKDGKIVDPLTKKKYSVTFTGVNGTEEKSEIQISNNYAKVWFKKL